MAIETCCPNPDCQKKSKVAENLIGKTARCKHCNARFRIRPGMGELLEVGLQEKESAALPDLIPDDLDHLQTTVCETMLEQREDQTLMRPFFAYAKLPL